MHCVAGMKTAPARVPDDVAEAASLAVRAVARERRKSPQKHDGAGADVSDDSNSSVAGEEDPGAAMDMPVSRPRDHASGSRHPPNPHLETVNQANQKPA